MNNISKRIMLKGLLPSTIVYNHLTFKITGDIFVSQSNLFNSSFMEFQFNFRIVKAVA